MVTELLLGCGSTKDKRLSIGQDLEWHDLVTLDFDADHNPDVVWNLDVRPLPFEDNQFDEIHAYEVLEHLGSQGDWKYFFEEFTEYHRIVKPGGLFYATVPWWQGKWAWGDPGHTRVIQPETLSFLSQDHYKQVGTTCSSDYRFAYKADWRVVGLEHSTPPGEPFEGHLLFVMKAMKGQED